MSLYDALALFLIMSALAAIPSASVALVVVRSATLGIRNGMAAAMGIVVGDLVFIVMAILGLSALSELMGAFFAIIRYIAAGYLIWFGIGLMRSCVRPKRLEAGQPAGGIVTSFIAGLALTLGDVKAILFYASLFPAFVDVPALNTPDIAVIIAITIFTVGGVKIAYALLAKAIIGASRGFVFERQARLATGGLMIGAGGYLIAKT